MENEPLSFPNKLTSDTPELVQECFDMQESIVAQLDDWVKIANSKHPAIRLNGVASLIVSNCTPKERPVDDLSGSSFETQLTPKETKDQLKKRHQLGEVSKIVQHESLDTEDELENNPLSNALEGHFEHVLSVLQNNPAHNDALQAIQYLHRLYHAEKIAEKKLGKSEDADDRVRKYAQLISQIAQHSLNTV